MKRSTAKSSSTEKGVAMSPKLSPFVIACLCFVLALPSSAAAQAGSLDSSFDGDGKVRANLTKGYDYASGLVVQADGKLVAAGVASGRGGGFALVRLAQDGGFDASFSGDGKVFTNVTSGMDGAWDIAVQPDDKLVVGGFAGGRGGRFALARYNPDGTLDQSFGGDGVVMTNFGSGDDFAYGVVLQPDGKIIAAGGAGGAGGRFALARYNTDGTLDDSFSGDGKTTTDFTARYDYIDAIAIQADGRIVAAGTANYYGSNARFALVRYGTDGSLDATFSADGKLTTNFTAGFDGAFALAIQPGDQRIVAAGQAGKRVAVARYDPAGTLDPTFGNGGVTTTNFTSGLDYADDVTLAVDEKIIVAGSADYYGASQFALVRYNADGTLDTGFSGDGRVNTNFTAGFDGALDVEIQPTDGRIVAAGAAGNHGATFALARYLAN